MGLLKKLFGSNEPLVKKTTKEDIKERFEVFLSRDRAYQEENYSMFVSLVEDATKANEFLSGEKINIKRYGIRLKNENPAAYREVTIRMKTKKQK